MCINKRWFTRNEYNSVKITAGIQTCIEFVGSIDDIKSNSCWQEGSTITFLCAPVIQHPVTLSGSATALWMGWETSFKNEVIFAGVLLFSNISFGSNAASYGRAIHPDELILFLAVDNLLLQKKLHQTRLMSPQNKKKKKVFKNAIFHTKIPRSIQQVESAHTNPEKSMNLRAEAEITLVSLGYYYTCSKTLRFLLKQASV